MLATSQHDARTIAMRSSKVCISIVLFSVCFASSTSSAILFVATNGNDAWSGTLAAPNNKQSDGPLATLAAARDKLRELKGTEDGIVTVRGGTYELPETLVFGPEDSGVAGHPVTYCVFAQERVTITGG